MCKRFDLCNNLLVDVNNINGCYYEVYLYVVGVLVVSVCCK